MAGRNTVRWVAQIQDQVSSKLAKIDDNFKRLGKSGGFKTLTQGVGMGVGISAFNMLGSAIGGATDFIKGSISAASDLNESMTKADVVFGDASKAVQDWSQTTADAFGISRQQALEAAGTYGNLFRAFGLSSDAAQGMSTSLVELAADLASFNNSSIDDALLALRSGLSGEMEPLKRFGVALSEVRLKEQALRMGLIKTTSGVLPIAIKTQAAYALIMKDTALAQGDFGRTSDGLANSQRRLDAKMADLSAKIGTQLLPHMTKFVNLLVGAVDGVEDLTTAVNELLEPMGGLDDLLGSLPFMTTSRLANELAGDLEQQAKATERAAEFSKVLASEQRYLGAAASVAAGDIEDTSDATATAGTKAQAAAKQIPDFRKAIEDVSRKARDLRDVLFDLGTRILDKMYGPAITAGRLEELKQQISDAKDEQKDFEKGSSGYIIAAGRIAELRQQFYELTGAQARAAGDTVYEAWLVKQIKLAEKAGLDTALWRAELALLQSRMRTVASAANTLYSTSSRVLTTTATPRQHGGPVTAGNVYTVGERGSETLVMNRGSGYVLPHGQGGGGNGGSPVVIQLVLDGQVIHQLFDKRLHYSLGLAAGTTMRT